MRIYINTSLLIRAVAGDDAARRFLEECCGGHECIVSTAHLLEDWKLETLLAVAALLARLGIRIEDVDIDDVRREALRLIEERGWSESRLLDVMHILAAVRLGCGAVAAVNRFIRSRCREYNLLYVNHYTGCPG